MTLADSAEYRPYSPCAHAYLQPPLRQILSRLSGSDVRSKRVFDLGCGDGTVANWLTTQGFAVQGCDSSDGGIAEAHKLFPDLDLRVASAYDDLNAVFGTFPFVLSLEVIEHIYDPRAYTHCIYNLLEPGGYAILSTPYHGYWKNVALAIAGKMDDHYTALWDHGHIKFWSPKTIRQLLTDHQFRVHQIIRVGRIPQLAKSMIIVAQKPED
jgi:2-polyprenyl-3-methyl-5-hydroxy-6-metoxy-1,4-benzoquinol methylase